MYMNLFLMLHTYAELDSVHEILKFIISSKPRPFGSIVLRTCISAKILHSVFQETINYKSRHSTLLRASPGESSNVS